MQIILAFNEAEGYAWRNYHNLRGVQVISLDEPHKIDGARITEVYLTPAAIGHKNFPYAYHACARAINQVYGLQEPHPVLKARR